MHNYLLTKKLKNLSIKYTFSTEDDKKEKKKYLLNFPIFLYFFFEKLNFSYWTSTTVKPNHFICSFPANQAAALASVLSGELFLNNSHLVEVTAFDLTNQDMHSNDFFFFLKSNPTVAYYSFYFFLIKKRISFFFHNLSTISSIESFYSSANWLERETSEMFGIQYIFKKDSRNLLLDYGFTSHPLLKKFPASGFSEVVFNSFSKTTCYSSILSTEL